MIKGAQRRRRNRRLGDKNQPLPPPSVAVISVTHQTPATHIQLIFSQAVNIKLPTGLPWRFGTDGNTVTSVVAGNNTPVIVVVVSADVASGETYQMPPASTADASSSTGLPIAQSFGTVA